MKLTEIIAKGLIASSEFGSNLVAALDVNQNLARVLAEGLKVPTQEEVEEVTNKTLVDFLRNYNNSELLSHTVGSFWYEPTDFSCRATVFFTFKKESGEVLTRSSTLSF